jgi:hypothetical protein
VGPGAAALVEALDSDASGGTTSPAGPRHAASVTSIAAVKASRRIAYLPPSHIAPDPTSIDRYLLRKLFSCPDFRATG